MNVCQVIQKGICFRVKGSVFTRGSEAVSFCALSAASASAISLVAIPPTNAEAAEQANRFRFRFRIPGVYEYI